MNIIKIYSKIFVISGMFNIFRHGRKQRKLRALSRLKLPLMRVGQNARIAEHPFDVAAVSR